MEIVFERVYFVRCILFMEIRSLTNWLRHFLSDKNSGIVGQDSNLHIFQEYFLFGCSRLHREHDRIPQWNFSTRFRLLGQFSGIRINTLRLSQLNDYFFVPFSEVSRLFSLVLNSCRPFLSVFRWSKRSLLLQPKMLDDKMSSLVSRQQIVVIEK